MAVWVVRAGDEGQWADIGLAQGQITLNYNFIPDYTDWSKADLKEELAAYDWSIRTIRDYASDLILFRDRIKIGEFIVVPFAGNTYAAIGIVIGEYKYIDDNPNWAMHTRRVSWVILSIPFETIDSFIKDSLEARGTVFRVRPETPEAAQDWVQEMIESYG